MRLISSMATRMLLAELCRLWSEQGGAPVAVESVGGVDAARRVRAGEAFDGVVLAADVIDQLIAQGHMRPGSRRDLVRSGVAVAVRAGAPRPDLGDEAAVRAAVLAARTVGYSTGPSGVALQALFERWGIAAQVAARTVQAPPGVPVARLVAGGEVELGFQQLAEMLGVEGIDVLGPLPPAIQIVTVFSAGVSVHAQAPAAVAALLDFMVSPAAAPVKLAQGMAPAMPQPDS